MTEAQVWAFGVGCRRGPLCLPSFGSALSPVEILVSRAAGRLGLAFVAA